MAWKSKTTGGLCPVAATCTYFKTWWGEGEVKFYLDGDTAHPTLCGTGTEDYIGTGWGQGEYAHEYQGCPIADHAKYQYSFYRLHVPDPIFFHRDIRVTMQQIGCWAPDTLPQLHGAGLQLFHGDQPVDVAAKMQERGSKEPICRGHVVVPGGYGLFERRDDWSSCAWFYLDRPTNSLPALPPATERLAGLA